MIAKGILYLIAVGSLSLAADVQNAVRTAPIPGDALEIVTGDIRGVRAAADREAVLQLLNRARDNYALRTAGRAYELKVNFKVKSGGLTQYDGAWQMEDVFDPKEGFRWTAQAPGSYSITRISRNGKLFGEETASYVPLRLQEARAALFDPIPSAEAVSHANIRTSAAVYNGTQLRCVLLSASGNASRATSGRRWDETEECIDPQSGLLRTHSQVPGRYTAYDYSDAPQLDGHILPRKVIITEAGKTVTKISVERLTELPNADPSLFVPTEEMKARGRAITMAGARKITRIYGGGPVSAGATAQAVCVFGLVTPSGQLVEAHSLQPSDPNSDAAVEAAKQIDFSEPAELGVHPQQHFVFVIEKFISSR